MARRHNLASMSLDSLLRFRDEVTQALSDQAEALRAQLESLTSGVESPRRRRRLASARRSKLTGRKVAPKYRDKSGNTWSGRGAQPRWMTAAIKAGAQRDDFLIAKPAKADKKPARRKTRR